MKVIYRSVAKIRRQGSLLPWISAAVAQAASTFILFTKTVGIASLLRIVCSAAVVLSTIPIIGSLFVLSTIYKRIVQWILIYFYPDEKLKVVLDSHLRVAFDCGDRYGIVASLVLMDGVADIGEIRRKFGKWINSSPKRLENARSLLITKFGCYVWKTNDGDFKIERQILLSSRRVDESTLRGYVCELNSYALPSRLPAWQIMVVTLNEQTPRYAMIIRLHHVLAATLLNLNPSRINHAPFHTGKIPHENQRDDLRTLRQHAISAGYTLASIVSCLIEVPRVLMNELTLKHCHLKPRKSSGAESVYWTDPLNLQFVKKMADKSGVGRNDVLVSCITGSLRRYYSVVEGYVPENVLSAINFKNEEISGFASLSLPLQTTDPKCRLLQLRRRMAAKRRATSIVKIMFLKYVDRVLPYPLAKAFLQNLTKKYSCVIEDYCIPSIFRELSKNDDVRMVYCWRPLIGPIGMSFSLMYSEDKVAVSVKTDLSSIQRPDILLTYFVREVKNLAFDLNVREERQH